MTRQVLSRRMVETNDLQRLRFQLVAAEYLARMGARIRDRREELGLSRGEVVDRMPGRVSENQLYRWEKGQHRANPDSLEELAKALECDVSRFMAEPPEERRTPSPFGDGAEESQLDRIESLLIELLERLGAEDVLRAVAQDEIEGDVPNTPPRQVRPRQARRPRAS